MDNDALREGRTVAEVARVLWRRKIVVALMTAVVIGLAGGWVVVQTPRYRSTSTLALGPTNPGDSITLLSQINTIIPLYTEAIRALETSQIARAQLHADHLAKVSVRTFRDAPIIKLDATSSDPRLAYQTAQATTDALIVRLKRGEVGLPNVKVLQIDRPILPETPVWPLVKLTLVVALMLGLGLGVAAGLLIDQLAQNAADERAVRADERFGTRSPEPRSRGSTSRPQRQASRRTAPRSDLDEAADDLMHLANAAARREPPSYERLARVETERDRVLRPQPTRPGERTYQQEEASAGDLAEAPNGDGVWQEGSTRGPIARVLPPDA